MFHFSSVSHRFSKGDLLRIIYFGTPEFSIKPLRSLLNSEHEVLAVVTQPDRKKGRGKKIALSPVKLEAQRAGLEILQPYKVKDPAFIDEIRTLNPAVIVVVAYGQILPLEILKIPEFGCINIHASILPKYRGAAPINWAIVYGEGKTGVTTMLMDEGMDTGPILLQEETEIRADDTASSLSVRLSGTGAGLLLKTLEKLEQGSLEQISQSGNASYAPVLKKADGLIKWSKSAPELCNFINGMNPWPGAYGFIEGKRVKILKAISVEGSEEPGVINRVGVDELLVGTGRGLLSIEALQPSGKPEMAVRAFIQGRKLSKGMRFDEEPVG